jgi:hypothetical protein
VYHTIFNACWHQFTTHDVLHRSNNLLASVYHTDTGNASVTMNFIQVKHERNATQHRTLLRAASHSSGRCTPSDS